MPASYGGVAQRWVLISSAQRQPQAQRPGDTPGRKQSAQAGTACRTLCRTALAWEAEAPQALARFARDVPTTCLAASPVCPTPQYGKRGRPGPGAPPDQSGSHIASALASRRTERQARVDQQSCFLLATHALDEALVAAPAGLDGYTGPAQAERGFRCLKDPQCLASSRSLTKPERLMALFMGMTGCWLVYAA